MITFALNNDWHLMLENGNIKMFSGDLQISQDASSSCRVWRAEMDFDITRGVDFEKVFNQKLLFGFVQSELIRQIDLSSQVLFSNVLNLALNDRTLTGDLIITTNDGVVNGNI